MGEKQVPVAGGNAMPNLEIERRGAVLHVTIAREARHNALSRATIAEIDETFAHHARDADLRAAVLSGAGVRSFAAGGDIRDLEAVRTEAEAAAMSRETRAAFDRIRDFPVPVVAVLNGTALGGGAELAAACDFRVAAAHARIGFIQGRMGLITAWGGGIDLCAIVGYQTALRITLSAQILGAEEARAIGLVDAVAAEDEPLDMAVARLLEPIIAQPRPVLAGFKELNRAARRVAGRAGLEQLETALFARTWVDDAHWDAVEAFNARRKS